MKKFIRKVQALGKKAEEIRAAMEKMPPKVAEFKQALALTSRQFMDLRSEVHSAISDLKMDGEDRLVDALHEINGSTEVFAQAGYELGAVDMEISPSHMIIVHLYRVEDVRDSMLRSLLKANQSKKITHALLRSLIQAEEMADKVDLNDQVYYKLRVNVGPIPSVKLCWKNSGTDNPDLDEKEIKISAQKTLENAPSSSFAGYGSGSFFDQRYTSTKPSPVMAGSEPLNVNSSTAESEIPNKTTHAAVSQLSTTESSLPPNPDPLAKFKKMPDLAKKPR